MSAPGPRAPAERPTQEAAERLQTAMAEMSMAEKFACEREARHDVAARGRIADVAPVQHYLTHVRCEDGRHPSAGGERRPPRTPHAADEHAVPRGLRGWLRWGEDGPPAGPIVRGC